MRTFTCRAPHCVEEVADSWDVCGICWAYRHHWTDGISRLWVQVHRAVVPSGSTGYAERVSGSAPTSSMPLRTGPLMAMETALLLMTQWADAFIRRGLAGSLPQRGTVSDDFLFDRAALLCRMHDDSFTGGPLAGDYYLDIYRAHWALARVDNARATTVRMDRPCPACDRLTLIERNAGEFGQCLTCARKWTQAALSIQIDGTA
jgi:hypothetical protein